jgi:hypothetical protein
VKSTFTPAVNTKKNLQSPLQNIETRLKRCKARLSAFQCKKTGNQLKIPTSTGQDSVSIVKQMCLPVHEHISVPKFADQF